ncbi:hypothetical protein D5086_014691 [Populus alba]|uniref:Uncharacterized protein n=1 Tax=Populus alba TaxID=43335 RepID=A0ACC4BYY9_POPAL
MLSRCPSFHNFLLGDDEPVKANRPSPSGLDRKKLEMEMDAKSLNSTRPATAPVLHTRTVSQIARAIQITLNCLSNG